MSKKVKKGSALITVLIFSLIFIVISGVSAMAVVNTLKGNSREEKYQTLYYEAEAGIEKAISYVNANKYSIGPTIFDETTLGHSFTINGSAVKLIVTRIPVPGAEDYYIAESTATKSGVSRTVKTKVKKWASSMDLFKYSFCGQEVEFSSTGTYNGSGSRVNSSDAIVNNNIASPPVLGEEENARFNLPVFKKVQIDPVTGAEVLVDTITYTSSIEINFSGAVDTTLFRNKMDSQANIKKIQITPVASGRIFTVYLVNAGVLKLNFSSAGADIKDIMIICSGDVEFTSGTIGPYGTINYGWSSIIGKTIKVSNAVLTSSYTAYDPNYPDAIGGNSPLKSNELGYLINGHSSVIGGSIKDYIPNYEYGGGGGPGGSTKYEPFDYE